MKHCCVCKELKPLTEFNLHGGRKDGRQTYCIPCYRAETTKWYYKRKHGISLEERDNLLKDQDYKCLICSESIQFETGRGSRTGSSAVVDHCHGKGHIRGILCGHCNTGLGSFRDNIQFLESAIEYLKNNQ
jgi:hypothetical protein